MAKLSDLQSLPLQGSSALIAKQFENLFLPGVCENLPEVTDDSSQPHSELRQPSRPFIRQVCVRLSS